MNPPSFKRHFTYLCLINKRLLTIWVLQSNCQKQKETSHGYTYSIHKKIDLVLSGNILPNLTLSTRSFAVAFFLERFAIQLNQTMNQIHYIFMKTEKIYQNPYQLTKRYPKNSMPKQISSQ
jgi:hypothetical protein